MNSELLLCAAFTPHLIGFIVLAARGRLNRWLAILFVLLGLPLMLTILSPTFLNGTPLLPFHTGPGIQQLYLVLPFVLILAPLWAVRRSRTL